MDSRRGQRGKPGSAGVLRGGADWAQGSCSLHLRFGSYSCSTMPACSVSSFHCFAHPCARYCLAQQPHRVP